ncbi:MAG: GTPase [Candidatus Hodarchaeales archaeon]|jgi:nucleolar GTP-binding protein
MTLDNPFSEVKQILSAEKLVEIVFAKAMKATASGGSIGISPVTRTRRTEVKRVQTCAKLFRDKLHEIVYQFPSLEELPIFYQEILDISIGLDNLKRILGSLDGSSKIIWKINKEHTSIIWKARPLQAKKTRRAAFSRFSSVIQQLKSRLLSLEDLRYKLRRLPIFDFENPIIVTAGYPNVGKSSFVKSVTNAKPEIADYPFTTKNVTVGHYQGEGEYSHLACQVVDTPGLLDRSLTDRNEIELKALAALLHLPSLIIFIFDPTQIDHWDAQFQLFLEIKEKITIPIQIALNKVDLLDFSKQNKLTNEIKDRLDFRPLLMEANDTKKARRLMNSLFTALMQK